MTKATVSTALLVALALVAPALAAKTGAAARKPATKQKKADEKKVTVPREYAKMAELVGATDAQKKRIQERAEAKKKALAAWDKQYGDRLAELKAKAADAQRAGNAAALQALDNQILAAEAAKARVEAAQDAMVLAALTPQQRQTWEAHRLAEDVTKHCRAARLSGEQNEKVQALCREAAVELAKAPADPAKRAEVLQTVIQKVAEQVLTPEQAARINQKAAGKDRD